MQCEFIVQIAEVYSKLYFNITYSSANNSLMAGFTLKPVVQPAASSACLELKNKC